MLSRIMTQKLTRHFHFQDSNKDGFVERADWERCAQRLADLRSLSLDAPEYDALRKMHVEIWMKYWLPADSDGDGKVSLQEYLDLTDQLKTAKKLSMEMLLDLFGTIFDTIDLDGDKKITLDDYKSYFRAWGVDESLADDAFASLDLNGDGVLTRMSFVQFGANFFVSDDENEFGNMLFGVLE